MASGELARTVVSLEPPVVQSDLVDPGAVTAQARLTSFGESSAYAANPFPGTLALGIPGQVDGSTGGATDIPEYPLVAASSYPATPTSHAGAGSLDLSAKSGADSSSGAANDGGNRTEAMVSVDRASDLVTASSKVSIGSVQLGPGLTLAGIRSSAMATRSPGGDVERASEFSIASVIVLGHTLRLTENGFELAGVKVPLGGSGIDPVRELLASVADQGATLKLLDQVETDDGVISSGLQVTQRLPTEVNGVVATVTTTFGRAAASVANTARPAPAAPASGPPPATSSDVTSTIPAPSTRPVPEAMRQEPTPAQQAAPVSPPTVSDEPKPISWLQAETANGGRFYPVLALAATALAASLELFRKLGVKVTWS